MDMWNHEFTHKQKGILILSFLLCAVSIGFQIREYEESKVSYPIYYESVDIKSMTEPHVATKTSKQKPVDKVLTTIQESLGDVEEVFMGSKDFPATEDSANSGDAGRIWYLPTENGSITTYPNYDHVAYDIISWRGTAETVYPIADGMVSGIYTDPYGALVVTILHEVDGVKYTSQYVHLSRYADGLSVGQRVTHNTPIGQMGSTGWSTGVHLHIAVLDCALFDSRDPNCSDLNAWYRYDKKRLSENFYGLGVLVYVPNSWNER